jgi:hypothetical protein
MSGIFDLFFDQAGIIRTWCVIAASAILLALLGAGCYWLSEQNWNCPRSGCPRSSS